MGDDISGAIERQLHFEDENHICKRCNRKGGSQYLIALVPEVVDYSAPNGWRKILPESVPGLLLHRALKQERYQRCKRENRQPIPDRFHIGKFLFEALISIALRCSIAQPYEASPATMCDPTSDSGCRASLTGLRKTPRRKPSHPSPYTLVPPKVPVIDAAYRTPDTLPLINLFAEADLNYRALEMVVGRGGLKLGLINQDSSSRSLRVTLG